MASADGDNHHAISSLRFLLLSIRTAEPSGQVGTKETDYKGEIRLTLKWKKKKIQDRKLL